MIRSKQRKSLISRLTYYPWLKFLKAKVIAANKVLVTQVKMIRRRNKSPRPKMLMKQMVSKIYHPEASIPALKVPSLQSVVTLSKCKKVT